MIRFLTHIAVSLLSAGLGLLVAAWLVPGVSLQLNGFLLAVGVYTAAAALFGPFMFNLARKHATAMLGGAGLFATLLALWVATLVPGGLTIAGLQAWLIAMLVVWLVTALGGWALLWFAFGAKRKRSES